MTARAVLPLALAVLASCAGPRQKLESVAPEEGYAPEEQSFAIVLHNRHWLDLNIFVQADGQASRVGTVTASSSRSVVLPSRMLGQGHLIRVIAEAIGDETTYSTEYLSVLPGQVVLLNLESRLAGSSYSIQ